MVDPHGTVGGRKASRHPAMRRALRVLGWLALAVVAIPLLLVVAFVGREVLVSRDLADLCGTLVAGRELGRDTGSGFESRSARVPERAEDWFDREYRRIHETEVRAVSGESDLTVLFAKPGIGYYACIVRHRGGRIEAARFVDRSS